MTPIELSLTVNGERRALTVPPQRLLLEMLQRDLHLTGTKEGCGVGVCGACTVLMDGRPVSACLVLAAHAAGHEITTIEGLGRDGQRHPVQAAFLEWSAFQCGYCTPGMILAATALLQEHPAPSEEEIREYMSGNICRCTGYMDIIRAIQSCTGGAKR
ncbi:MAG: (2Fe-2S)-binding protein [Deltaproteobacteria bacterium]|nr:(2Fe-2S)-binding protein [Deltaproteobacteria bacterium]